MSAALEDLHDALGQSRAPVLVRASVRHLAEVLARDLDGDERALLAALCTALDGALWN